MGANQQRNKTSPPETAFVLLRMPVILKMTLTVIFLGQSAAVALMALGAWDVVIGEISAVDGALTGIAIVAGLFGVIGLWSHDRADEDE